jgi:hypothetical protein
VSTGKRTTIAIAVLVARVKKEPGRYGKRPTVGRGRKKCNKMRSYVVVHSMGTNSNCVCIMLQQQKPIPD